MEHSLLFQNVSFLICEGAGEGADKYRGRESTGRTFENNTRIRVSERNMRARKSAQLGQGYHATKTLLTTNSEKQLRTINSEEKPKPTKHAEHRQTSAAAGEAATALLNSKKPLST